MLFGDWPSDLAGVGNKICFQVNDPDPQLWVSDGTLAGSYKAKSFTNLTDAPGVAVGTRLFFAADDGIHGIELWSYAP